MASSRQFQGMEKGEEGFDVFSWRGGRIKAVCYNGEEEIIWATILSLVYVGRAVCRVHSASLENEMEREL